MEMKTLYKADLKRQKRSVAGIFVLLLLISLSLTAVLTVWNNSARYVNGEMDRLGYGEITIWVSGLSDPSFLAEEIASVDGVSSVEPQEILYSEYETGGQESDSEGQLITYDPQRYEYRFFNDDLPGYRTDEIRIGPGEIYVSPSLCSMFGISAGDTISFPIARNGEEKTFVVKGYFEDPFMGSSMIGMKSFLICARDHEEIVQRIEEAGIDRLSREGFMMHVFSGEEGISAALLNARINETTGVAAYVEFSHSHAAISGFMLTLQNVFTGFLLAFVAVLLLASLVALSHSIGSGIEQDYADMGILKTLGFTAGKLRRLQLMLYLTGILGGMAAGLLLAVPAAESICRMTVTTTGLLIPADPPMGLCLSALTVLCLILSAFIWGKTGRIGAVSPVRAIRGEVGNEIRTKKVRSPLRKKGLGFWIALRQIVAGTKRYTGVCLVALMLVFFASITGRVNDWLGPDGEGLMDAFNPADLHIAAQPMGETSIEEVEGVIARYTAITDQYMLGMPNVSVDGVDYTANVITQPERFHLLEGRTCLQDDEVVLTEFVASDLGVTVGDTVTVGAGLGTASYTVSGIYQCANDMGANIGMSREGYGRIGEESPSMWCTHYFIEDMDLQPAIMEALSEAFGGDVYLHENSWPGLFGILSAMRLLMVFLYIIVALFVLVVTVMTAQRLIAAECRDLRIYNTLGFSFSRLRRSLAMRFGMAAAAGSAAGTALAAFLTDPLVAALMRMEGISDFSSRPGIGVILQPGLAVTLLFLGFAWLAAGKIKQLPPAALELE